MDNAIHRPSPILPQINVGSYTGTPIGTPPIHIFSPARVGDDDGLGDDDVDAGRSRSRTCSNATTDSHASNHFTGNVQNAEREDTSTTADVKDGDSGGGSLCQSLRPRQIATLVIVVLGNISSAMFYSLLAPFFPTQASRKGATLYEVGLIYGVFQVIVFIMAPVFGYYMTRLGSKYLFVAGNFICSGCAILFGLLEWCPDGKLYVIMCLITRSVEAVGSAAQNTATFAIAAYTFSGHISVVMGFLQAGSCIGLMAGPPIGGVLYAAEGFFLPFAVTGAMFMFFSFISFFLLPSPEKETVQPAVSTSSKLRLLRIPVVPIIGFLGFVSQATLGFIDVALAKFLQEIKPDISAVTVGLVFLVPASIVVLTAPIFGFIADKRKYLGRPFIIVGCVVGCISFWGIGPAPFLTFLPRPSLKSIIITMAISGISWGGLVVTYQEYVTAARRHGLPEGLETQGIISGINGAFNSLGALLGPTIGGVLYEQIHFPWAATIIGGVILLAGFNLLVFMICESMCCPPNQEPISRSSHSDPDETSPLINS